MQFVKDRPQFVDGRSEDGQNQKDTRRDQIFSCFFVIECANLIDMKHIDNQQGCGDDSPDDEIKSGVKTVADHAQRIVKRRRAGAERKRDSNDNGARNDGKPVFKFYF